MLMIELVVETRRDNLIHALALAALLALGYESYFQLLPELDVRRDAKLDALPCSRGWWSPFVAGRGRTCRRGRRPSVLSRARSQGRVRD